MERESPRSQQITDPNPMQLSRVKSDLTTFIENVGLLACLPTVGAVECRSYMAPEAFAVALGSYPSVGGRRPEGDWRWQVAEDKREVI
jgi:hypothetical protein